MASNPISKLTEQEYLAIERAAEFRSEFIDGEMFAMAGASVRHILIQRNLIGELYIALRGGACGPVGSDSRLRISSRAYVYPDVTVICKDPPALDQDDDNLDNPVVVFEIVSPSTEKFDRGRKSDLYRTVGSLTDYVLVSQDRMRVEGYARQPDGTWFSHECEGPDAELKIDSINVSMPLRRIYDGVTIRPAI
ncbi:MAG: Uma2 family endonuclease [Bryobacteraceae bacterium]